MTAFKETAKPVNKMARESKIPRVKIEVGRSDKVIKWMCRKMRVCNTMPWDNIRNANVNELSGISLGVCGYKERGVENE